MGDPMRTTRLPSTAPRHLIARFCYAALVFPSGAAFAATWTLNPEGTGDFPTIQAAITSLQVHQGDVIELVDGTYTGTGNREVRFFGKNVTLKSQSGNPSSCTIDVDGHHGFIYDSDEGPQSVVSGVTFANADGNEGGAIRCYVSSPTIEHCIFRNNVGADGASIASIAGAPIINDCIFRDNLTFHFGGGGVFVIDGEATISNCLFERNHASDGGAAIGIDAGSSATITDCTFIDNDAGFYGGAIFRFEDNEGWLTPVTIDRCLFVNNNASWNGGAVFLSYRGITNISNSTFVNNIAGKRGGAFVGGFGGAITACTFFGNSAPDGGAISMWGDDISIENTIIAFGAEGGAIHVENGCPTITCTDIFGNAGGDWVGCLEDLPGTNGNFSADPLFCDAEGDDFRLDIVSPCLPGNHPDGADCSLIGAHHGGCGVSGVPDPDVHVRDATWGEIKDLFHGK